MKTQLLQFRVNDEEKALIEKCAKKEGMTVSEYVRASMLMSMVMDGELQALKIIWPVLSRFHDRTTSYHNKRYPDKDTRRNGRSSWRPASAYGHPTTAAVSAL